jgi:hypothetical protein
VPSLCPWFDNRRRAGPRVHVSRPAGVLSLCSHAHTPHHQMPRTLSLPPRFDMRMRGCMCACVDVQGHRGGGGPRRDQGQEGRPRRGLLRHRVRGGLCVCVCACVCETVSELATAGASSAVTLQSWYTNTTAPFVSLLVIHPSMPLSTPPPAAGVARAGRASARCTRAATAPTTRRPRRRSTATRPGVR